MADNSYAIEIRQASSNGWFTPDQARSYYGRYSRDYYIVHWWGSPGAVGRHDQTVNYILNTAAAGNMSVNYVLSNDKISLLVGPDDVSFGAQGGNPNGINVEHEPTLNDEGYKKSGWLREQLEQRNGHVLALKKHSDFFATACPGTISLDRIEQETDKWRRKVYDQPSVPVVIIPPAPPAQPQLIVVDDQDRNMFTRANAKLVNFNDLSVVKAFDVDTPMAVSQKVRYNNMELYRTVSATNQNRLQGFLVADLKDSVTPPPVPAEPPKPEWVSNLRDIDDTEYWFNKDQPLIDITTSMPTVDKLAKNFAKNDSFVSSAVTKVGSVEYRITNYSFTKSTFNGVPIDSLTLTKPGVPDIKPVPISVPNYEERLRTIEKELENVVRFLTSLSFKK